jgi:magnesium and cobalt exporter, CNNM family
MALEILIVLLLILVQGLFAMGEMAIVSARKARLKQMADEGNKGAAAALALAEHPSRFFSTVQIGLTLTNIIAGAYGGVKVADSLIEILAGMPSLTRYAEPLAFGSVVVAITFLTLILGELVPKRLAVSRPEAIAAGVGRSMALLSRVAAPAVWFLSAVTDLVLRLMPIRHGSEPAVTDEEVKLLMQQGTDSGHFHPAEKSIVGMALRLGDRRVSALMTPRPQVEWLDLEDPIEETKEKVLNSHYSRFPVAEGGRRHIVGVVEVKDLLASELAGKGFDIRAVMKPPLYIPESAPALKALESFRRTGAPIALIVDEYGDFQGIVTLEDLLEALVGDLPEPGQEEEPAVAQRADGSWLVDGMLPIDQLKDAVGMTRLPAEEETTYQTVAGLVMDRLRRIPKATDWFEIDDYRFEVVDMDGRRIDKVLVSRKAASPDEESESRPAA